jgi:hypothetical protein
MQQVRGLILTVYAHSIPGADIEAAELISGILTLSRGIPSDGAISGELSHAATLPGRFSLPDQVTRLRLAEKLDPRITVDVLGAPAKHLSERDFLLAVG